MDVWLFFWSKKGGLGFESRWKRSQGRSRAHCALLLDRKNDKSLNATKPDLVCCHQSDKNTLRV